MIDAESNYENFNPRPIEVNRADMQNLFGDLMLYENGCVAAEALRDGGESELSVVLKPALFERLCRDEQLERWLLPDASEAEPAAATSG